MNNPAELLRDEYLKRRTQNRHYSIRAFARDLGVSHTYLSLVFSGKRALSTSQAAQMGMLLGLTGTELQAWLQNCVRDTTSKRGVNEKLKQALGDSQPKPESMVDLQIEYSKVLAGWYYLALLDATYLKEAKNDPAWFAEKLGLTTVEVRDAIDRLKSLEMLEEKNGKLRKTKNFIHLPTKHSQAPLRAYHQALIQKGVQALADPRDEAFQSRYISGGTIAIKNTKIKKARERLQQILSDFIVEFASTDADAVYHLNMQFFSLTQDTKRKGKSK